MAEPVQGEAVWKFAIMFQIGMILVGVVLIVIGITSSAAIPIGLGVVFLALAAGGIYYARRTLRDLRK